MASYFFCASMLARSLSNLEMSAPETKALPPAPLTTTTRIAGSSAYWLSSACTRSHMSRDTALCLLGLLKMTWPTGPSLRPMTFSSCMLHPLLAFRTDRTPVSLPVARQAGPQSGTISDTDTLGRRRDAIALATRRAPRSGGGRQRGLCPGRMGAGSRPGATEDHGRVDCRGAEGRQGELLHLR